MSIYGQNISDQNAEKPFKIHGQIGSSLGFYHSNELAASRPPWSYGLYAQFNPEIYGITIPVSFMINQYGSSYTNPFSQFGISPRYKWATLHLGYGHIRMNPLVFDGQSFRGGGLELKPGIFRFSAFYGKLNNRVNADSTAGHFVQPQFLRTGYGVKVGVGNFSRHFELTYFYAKDDTASIRMLPLYSLPAHENAVLGSSFKTTFWQKIVFKGDVAASGLTKDLTAPSEDTTRTGFPEEFFAKLIPFRSSTSVQYAGQAGIDALFKNFTTSVHYKRVDPEFKSLGTPYMIDDTEIFFWMNNLNLFSNKLNISTHLSSQHNNLRNNLSTEMRTRVATLNVNASPVKNLYLYLNYSGYSLFQKDGTIQINDSVRMNQQIHQIGFMPGYTIFEDNRSHNISTSINYMSLRDKNPVTSPHTDSYNLSVFANYTLGFNATGISVGGSGSYSSYVQDTTHYDTYGVNINTSGQFLKKRNLSAQLSAGYYFNQSSYSETRNNMTFSVGIGYRYLQHSFRLNTHYIYTPYNPINEVIERAMFRVVAGKNFVGSVDYQYSF